jgi:hypothetical protein
MKKQIIFERSELHCLYEAIGKINNLKLAKQTSKLDTVMAFQVLIKMQYKFGNRLLKSNYQFMDIKCSFDYLEVQVLKQIMDNLIEMLDFWEDVSLQIAIGKLHKMIVSL